jgi:methyl-accepting chemotaxis protein
MTKKNYFWKGILLGAAAGGVLSLVDKGTRQEMKEKVQHVSGKLSYIVRNPKEISQKISGTVGKMKSTYEQVSEDISYIMEKVDELRELTPQVTEIVKETKDTFSKSEESSLLDEVPYTKE